MYKRRRINVLALTIGALSGVIILCIVYAAFTGQLNIRSGAGISRTSTWDIHFENVSRITTTGSAKVLNGQEPEIDENDSTTIDDYMISLTSPNDSISFTFDVVNGGNYNAKITSVNVGTPACDVGGDSTDTSAVNMCNNLTYSLTYASGASVNVNDVLYAKDKLTLKVTLTFNDISNPALLPTDDVNISNLGITINFEQQGSAEVDENTGIVSNYRVYHIGDKITLNNEDYWVIKNSGAGDDYVTALKDEPLTNAEVTSFYSKGNTNGYGGIPYYVSETCNSSSNYSGCTTDYQSSHIKEVVDAWVLTNFTSNELKIVYGYDARLITVAEYNAIPNTNTWKSSSRYGYRTMTPYGGYAVYDVRYNQGLDYRVIWDSSWVIRPVINIYKSVIENSNN